MWISAMVVSCEITVHVSKTLEKNSKCASYIKLYVSLTKVSLIVTTYNTFNFNIHWLYSLLYREERSDAMRIIKRGVKTKKTG